MLIGGIVIFQRAGNGDRKNQKVSDPEMPIITPAILTFSGGRGGGEALRVLIGVFTQKIRAPVLSVVTTPMD